METGIKHYVKDSDEVTAKETNYGSRQDGYDVELQSQVIRVQDDAVIAEGSHSLWIPGHLSM